MRELDKIEELVRYSKQRVFTRAEVFRMIELAKGWTPKTDKTKEPNVIVLKDSLKDIFKND